MSWQTIIKSERLLPRFIKLAEDNMDKFNEQDKPLVIMYITGLKKKFDRETFEGLRMVLRENDLIDSHGHE